MELSCCVWWPGLLCAAPLYSTDSTFLYITLLIIAAPGYSVWVSAAQHRLKERWQSHQRLMICNKWSLPGRYGAAQWGSHRGPQSQRGFITGFTPDLTFSVSLHVFIALLTSLPSRCTSVSPWYSVVPPLMSLFCHICSTVCNSHSLLCVCVCVCVCACVCARVC